ncbi:MULTISPECIES: hypothetical protein [Microbacterium]|uniref:hypothetical protein n=1 Tax=Microbacterium TaxID=33882 RepID=UPI003D6AD52E|nr:hypothetical protein [Microbacteriaceae bacterium K1510]
MFYEELANPLWVAPLMEAFAFDSPPEPTVDSDGLIREVYWPEMDYLTRMADFVPNDVVTVLLRLKASSNSWVRRGTIEIAAKVPIEDAVQLAEMISAWAPNGLGWRTDPKDLTLLTVRLLEARKPLGIRLAQILFEPVEGNEHGRPRAVMEDYWYEQGLPQVVEAMGGDSVSQLRKWLDKYELLSGAWSDDHDYTSMRRPAIAAREHAYRTIEQALIDSQVVGAIRALESESPAEIVRRLAKSPTVLGWRILLHVVARTIDSTTNPTVDLLDAAVSAIGDLRSTDPACRLELAELVRALHAKDEARLISLSDLINAGPFASRDRLTKRLRTIDGESADERSKRADEFVEQWQHRLLASIGSDALPSDLREKLDALNASRGQIENPNEALGVVTTWSGPTSPKERDELASMSPSEIVSYLQGWRPGDRLMSPTHEGLGRELTSLVSAAPKALQGEHHIVDHLRPTYVRAILTGWSDAVKEGRNPEWPQVLEVVSGTLQHDDASEFEPEGHEFDDDISYLYAKRAAISLLEELAKKIDERAIPEDVIATVADLLIASLDDESAWAQYAGEALRDDGMDPLTLSINRTWPIAVRGLTRLIVHGDGAPWYQRSRNALDRELARDDPAGSAAAVIGENSAVLLHFGGDWMDVSAVRVFGTEEGITTGQQIALTTALLGNQFNRPQFDLLRGPMMAAIASEDELTLGWRGQGSPLELVGRWIVIAYLIGHIEIDDPLMLGFFDSVAADTRGDVIGHIAWTNLHADTVDRDILDRIEHLWELRAQHVEQHPEDSAELKDFYWFISNGKHSSEWWLPRLVQAARLVPDLQTHGLIGKQLAEASVTDPALAFTAIQLLMHHDDGPGMGSYDLTEHALPTVLASALDSGQPALAREASELMNKLGAKNMVHLRDQVEAIRRGRA